MAGRPPAHAKVYLKGVAGVVQSVGLQWYSKDPEQGRARIGLQLGTRFLDLGCLIGRI
jgi:hypothetical protein